MDYGVGLSGKAKPNCSDVAGAYTLKREHCVNRAGDFVAALDIEPCLATVMQAERSGGEAFYFSTVPACADCRSPSFAAYDPIRHIPRRAAAATLNRRARLPT